MGSVANGILEIAVLLVSVILHENAHGLVAYALGDRTAKAAGRITLNPVKHIDPVGSIILPALLYFTGGVMFGYAKPVPVSPQSLKGKDRWGFAAVALAGPVMNIVIALVCVVLARTQGVAITKTGIFATRTDIGSVGMLLAFAFELNVFLAAFNLIPIPPLDGSRLIRPALSLNGRRMLDRVEPYGFVIILLLITMLREPLFRFVDLIHSGLLHLLPI